MSIVNPNVIATIQLMLRNIPVMMGESRTLQAIRSSETLPGLASFSRPDPSRNLSLVKFHRDLVDRDFESFQKEYRAQYTAFRGKFLMIFDL